MGHAHNKPKLLPEKLVVLREHLGIDKKDLANKLEAARGQKVTSRRVSDYETGRGELTFMEALAYARLAGVPMELIIVDAVTVETFRKQIEKQLKHKKKVVQHTKKRAKA
jgi:hypothetical protein